MIKLNIGMNYGCQWHRTAGAERAQLNRPRGVKE